MPVSILYVHSKSPILITLLPLDHPASALRVLKRQKRYFIDRTVMNKYRTISLIACLLLASCVPAQTPSQPVQTEPTALPQAPSPSAETAPLTPTHPSQDTPEPSLEMAEATATLLPTPEPPTIHREFTSLLEAGQMSLFPIVTPGFVPEDLPLSKISANYYADGHEELFLNYTIPIDQPDANHKLLIAALSNAAEPETRETITRRKEVVLDLQEVTVGGQTGLIYWSPSVAAGNSAHLEWRLGELNIHLILYGNWPAPDEQQPHRLDGLLLQIAASFQAASYLPTITPLPSGWQTFQAVDGQVSFALPPGWEALGENTYQGTVGSARLEVLPAPGAWVGQACEWEANAHPEGYGENPVLLNLPQKTNAVGFKTDACLIAPADGRLSAVVLPNPAGRDRDRFLVLRLDTPEAVEIALSLKVSLNLPAQPTLSGPSYNIPPGTIQPAEAITPETTRWNDLTLEAYPIISASVDAPGNFEFSGRIPQSVLEKRRSLRQAGQAQSWDSVTLGGKIYRLVETWVETPYGGQTQAQVTLDGKPIYQYNLLPYAGSSHIYRLGNDGARWILEVNGMLVVDGKIINQEMGYEEVFDWSILNGKPFYFYTRAGQTYLSYDGQDLPEVYDQVFHKACCEPSMFNVGSSKDMVWFYALKEGVWYYVEVGDF
jgi:hypothetical protein